jgi:two-component system sensor histidine kinase/response regulator
MTAPGIRQQLSPKRILVAEDEPLVAYALRMVLVVDGHLVDTAEDGRQALAMFDGGTYDLVITDFKMANMDGLELAEAIKKRPPSTPIILLTAYAEAIKSTGGNVSNVDIVLGKPWSVMELQNALERIKF